MAMTEEEQTQTVLVELKGGNLQRVFCKTADEVVCVDRDTDGVPTESIHKIGGEDALVFIETVRPMGESKDMLQEAMAALGL